jgi:hypothetical protein
VTLHSAAATGDLFQAGAVQDQLTEGQRQMVMLAEHYDFIIGGDPDRDTIDLAILDAVTGRVHTQYSDAADGPAYGRMLAWAVRCAPGRRVWALESCTRAHGRKCPTCRVADVIWHRHSVTVSACRWATFHSPPSRRYTWVARKVKLRGWPSKEFEACSRPAV